MKRAEERERLLRSKLSQTHRVILRWRRDVTALLLDVLDPRSRQSLTHQRSLHDTNSVLHMVSRTVMPPPMNGPLGMMLQRNLEAGSGEIEVEITGQQLVSMQDLRPSQMSAKP